MSRPYITELPIATEDTIMAGENSQWWKTVSERMPTLLDKLESNDTLYRKGDELPPQAKKIGKGIYVFYEGVKPIYVGRTDRMRQRLH